MNPKRWERVSAGLTMVRDLQKTNPEYPRIRQRIAVSLVQEGDELARLGLREEALQANQAGIDLYEAVTQHDKTEARAKRELAVTWDKRGDIELMNGDDAGALREYRHSLSVTEPMAKADPQNSMLRLDVRGRLLGGGESPGLHR
jgi:hypothetical protein